jgi:hypothetical protein
MSPPVDVDVGCSGCFLHERTGRTCPMVRGGYDPEAAEARSRAVALHAAVLQDAGGSLALTELVRSEAGAPAALPAAVRLGLLLPAPVEPLSHESRKEVRHAAIPRRTAR